MKRYALIILAIVVAAALAIAVMLYIKNHGVTAGGTAGGGTATTTTGSLPSTGTQGSGGTTGGALANPITLPTPITTATGTSAGTGPASGQPAPSTFGVLSSNPVADYAVDSKNVITAIEPTGQVFAVANGQSAVVNSSTINNIIAAHFSFDGKKAFVSYGDPNNPQARLYDVATNVWTALPSGMQSPAWSPVGYQIAFLSSTGTGKVTLSTIDASNAASVKRGSAALLSLNATDLTIQWPTKGSIILADKPSAQNAGSIWVFNAATGGLTALAYNIPGGESIWSTSPAATYGLVFYNGIGGQGSTLQLQTLSGATQPQQLTFATLPSKCAFATQMMPTATTTQTAATASSTPSSTAKTSAKTKTPSAPTSTAYLALFCGVPRSNSGFASAHLPDDYNMMALFTSDDIYQVNASSGALQILWSDQAQNMDISDMKIINNVLFFINRYDQKLYGLTL